MSNKNVYLPNLNGVRAIAALMVVFFHIELIKNEFNLPNQYETLMAGGDMGVTLFFVLSGFLITFLLLEEESITSKISLKNFYMRRILRIWPLYFFVVLTSLFILPHISFMYEPPYSQPLLKSRVAVVLLYVFFSGNILTGLYSHVNFIRPTWSVSVEEQFYLFWPVLLKFSKNRVKTIRNVIAVYWSARLLIQLLNCDFINSHFHTHNILQTLDIIVYFTPLDSLSIGALTAYLFHQKKTVILNALFNKNVQRVIFILIPVLLYILQLHVNINIFTKTLGCNNLCFSLMFAAAIVNLAGNPNVIISLENKVMYTIGKISYGVYLYHWIVIIAVMNLLKYLNLTSVNFVLFNAIFYPLCLSLTILLAYVSFNLFEYKFISLKNKFSSITSGDLVKDTEVAAQANNQD